MQHNEKGRSLRSGPSQAVCETHDHDSGTVNLADILRRRRISRDLDDLLGIVRPDVDVSGVDWYHLTGLDLDVAQREQAGRAAG